METIEHDDTYLHCLVRLQERYEETLTFETYCDIHRLILSKDSNKAMRIGRLPKRSDSERDFYLIQYCFEYKTKLLFTVYDVEWKRVVTFLPGTKQNFSRILRRIKENESESD